MNIELQKLYDLLGGRIARNIYFWALILYLSFDPGAPAWQNFTTVLLYCLIMVLVYFNNIVLAPSLLKKRKFVSYFIAAIAASFFTALLYSFLFEFTLAHYPLHGVNGGQVLAGKATGHQPSADSLLSELKTAFNTAISLVFTFTLAWYMRDYASQQKAGEEAKKKQVEAELRFLKGQINPHFLFNTLNNLYGLAIKKSDTTPDAILKLSSILRYLLYESNAGVVPFLREREIMLAYIDLELLRLEKNDNLTFSIAADAAHDIPPLLWLPLLENVFKHGTRLIDDDYTIEYRFVIENNALAIYSKNKFNLNNKYEDADKAEGIGLNNLKQRLDILYPGKYKMTASTDNGYYIAAVSITLN